MITVNSFFSSTLATVDVVIGNFVHAAYQQFMQANTGLITLLFTVYVMFLGYRFLLATQAVSITLIVKPLILMLGVYGLIMNWQLYHLFVYRIFTTEPANIAKILVNAADQSHTNANIAEVLDDIYAAVINATMGFFGQVNFSAAGIAFIFYGLLVLIIGSLMCLFALLLFIYAKMMMAVALALGPIFILFILWEPTKGIFAAWLRKLITIALIPIVTSSVLVLMLSVIQNTLPQIKEPVENLQFYTLAPFLGLSIATSMLLSQVSQICSSLAGGITLASLSSGANIAKEALNKTGVARVGQALWHSKFGSMRSKQNHGRGNTNG